MAKVIIKDRKARPFWFGHPWVFSGAIERVRGQVTDGDIVEIDDHQGQVIGFGFWNSKSQIQVRLVSLAHEGALDDALLLARLDRAVALRHDLLRLPAVTNAYRVVHSEGDGLPGLIVDRVGDWLVLQVSSLGLAAHLEPLIERLVHHFRPAGIVERSSKVAIEEEGLVRTPGVVRGVAPPAEVEVVEHGLRYLSDPSEGQKTGWYSDQRDNRLLLAPLTAGQRVLDAFSFSGGFGLRFAQAGAAEVICIDSSGPALDQGRRSAALNGLADKVVFEEHNVLRILDHYAKEGRRFDVVLLDPPKFVHKRAALDRGLRLYHEVNAKAVRVLEPGGLLVTCSCSQHVLESHFEEMLGSVAKEGNLRFQEVFRGGQSGDHPILYPLEESRYLKCRALRVLR